MDKKKGNGGDLSGKSGQAGSLWQYSTWWHSGDIYSPYVALRWLFPLGYLYGLPGCLCI